MRSKITLVLIFLNVALFFFIFAFEREWRIKDIIVEQQVRVLGPSVANIKTLEIAGPAETIRMEKRGEGWMLTSPLEWPANPHAVERIRSELVLLKREASFTLAELEKNNQTLAEWGLDKPALTLTYIPAASEEGGDPPRPVVLRIGAESKVGNRLYMLSPDGERVLVVNRSLADSIKLPLEKLRNDAIFSIPAYEAKALGIHTTSSTGAAGASSTLRVSLRKEGNRWVFDTPIRTRANKPLTELAIISLNTLTAQSFPPAQSLDAARTGLANPPLRIKLEGTNRSEVLLIGSPVKDSTAPTPTLTPAAASTDEVVYYAKLEDRPAIFTTSVPTMLTETLRKAQETLRERKILDLEGRTITGITLRAPSNGYPDLVLQRLEGSGPGLNSGRWQIVRRDSTPGGSPTLPADPGAVAGLIETLGNLTAEKFESDAPSEANKEAWGFNRPEREVVITLAEPDSKKPPTGATSQIVLQIGRAKEVYAKLANHVSQDFVYKIDESILGKLPVVTNYFREKLLRELPAGARIRGLTLQRMSDEKPFFSRQLAENETWESALANEPPPRRAAVESLLQQLRRLSAKTIINDSFSPVLTLDGEPDQPWSYKLEASLDLVGGNGGQTQLMTLFFSERSGAGTQLAGSSNPGFEAIFIAEQALLDSLWTLTYGDRDPGPPKG